MKHLRAPQDECENRRQDSNISFIELIIQQIIKKVENSVKNIQRLGQIFTNIKTIIRMKGVHYSIMNMGRLEHIYRNIMEILIKDIINSISNIERLEEIASNLKTIKMKSISKKYSNKSSVATYVTPSKILLSYEEDTTFNKKRDITFFQSTSKEENFSDFSLNRKITSTSSLLSDISDPFIHSEYVMIERKSQEHVIFSELLNLNKKIISNVELNAPSSYTNQTLIDDEQSSSNYSEDSLERIEKPLLSSKKTVSLLTIHFPKTSFNSRSKHGMVTKSLNDITSLVYSSQMLFDEHLISKPIRSSVNSNDSLVSTKVLVGSENPIIQNSDTLIVYKFNSQKFNKAIQFSVSDMNVSSCEEVNDDVQLETQWQTLESTTEPAGDMAINLMIDAWNFVENLKSRRQYLNSDGDY